MQEKISVIVPVYNVEKYLDRCVQSLLKQTYKNLEIILVDDGSPDNCPKMCDDYSHIDSRIKVIHKQNGGLMDAWITGLKYATADIISFVDSDDWCELTMLEKLYKPMGDYGVDISICNRFKSFSKSKRYEMKQRYKGLYQGAELVRLKQDITDRPNNAVPLFRWNKLFRKSLILDNLKYCDTRCTIFEDACIVQPCLYDAQGIYFVEECLYNYFYRENSMINEFKPINFEKSSIYMDIFEKILRDKAQNLEAGLVYEKVRLAKILAMNIVLSKNKMKDSYLRKVCEMPYVTNIDQNYAKRVLSKRKYKLYNALINKNLFLTKLMCRSLDVLTKMKNVWPFKIFLAEKV